MIIQLHYAFLVLCHLCAHIGFTWPGEPPEDSKFEPWPSEPEYATSRLLKLITILNRCKWAGKKHVASLKLTNHSGVRSRDLRSLQAGSFNHCTRALAVDGSLAGKHVGQTLYKYHTNVFWLLELMRQYVSWQSNRTFICVCYCNIVILVLKGNFFYRETLPREKEHAF